MRRIFNSVVGILLIVAAVAGLVVSVGGIIGVGVAQGELSAGIKNQLLLLDQALTATDAGLQTASISVVQAQNTLTSIEGTVNGSATAIDDIVPTIVAIGGVVGDQLPGTLDGATKSLTFFAKTAGTIDSLMTVIGSLPLLNIPDYDPEVSLSESVTNFRDSVGGLGENLQSMQSGLEKTAANLGDVRGEVAGVGAALSGLNQSLDGTIEVLASYQAIVANLRDQVTAINAQIDRALNILRVAVIVILAWIGIASLGLLTQGLDLLERNRRQKLPEALPVPGEQLAAL